MSGLFCKRAQLNQQRPEISSSDVIAATMTITLTRSLHIIRAWQESCVGVLQYIAARCSVWYIVAVRWSALQYRAVHCSALQCTRRVDKTWVCGFRQICILDRYDFQEISTQFIVVCGSNLTHI